MAEYKREEQPSSAKKRERSSSTNTPLFHNQMSVTSQNALQLQRTLGNAAVQRLMRQKREGYPDDPTDPPLEIPNIQEYQAFPATKKVLYNFAEAEKSAENFDCLDAILNYEKNPNPFLARQIYNLFIGEEFVEESESFNPNTNKMQKSRVKKMTAAYAVNINNRYRVATREKIAKLDKGEIPANLFSEVKSDVILNIMDTFSRLVFTPEWSTAYAEFLNPKTPKPSVGSQIKGFFSSLFSGKKKKS